LVAVEKSPIEVLRDEEEPPVVSKIAGSAKSESVVQSEKKINTE